MSPWSKLAFWRRPVVSAEPERRGSSVFSTQFDRGVPTHADTQAAIANRLRAAAPRLIAPAGPTSGMDASSAQAYGIATIKTIDEPCIPEALYAWYGAQGFIGHQLAAIIAQHWLVDKACSMPANDAVRNGFNIALDGSTDAEEIKAMIEANKKMRIGWQMREFIRWGRIFGIRIALFRTTNGSPKYYEYPFNIDQIKPGQYKGISQIDPYWCVPELDMSVFDPADPEFYNPTWWRIGQTRYHRSHLRIFRTDEPADMLKPSYGYGGVPIPQKIYERVYAAERGANEAPQLLMTKRLTVWNTDLAEVLSNEDTFLTHMANFTQLRDNYGVKINDSDDKMEMFDTTLANVDAMIEGQYALVAAGAEVPITKLMEKSPPGGLNGAGDYEMASYHERLESIQENDLDPFLDHHNALLLRSEIEPKFGHEPGDLSANITWNPLDTPTAKELSETNKNKAMSDQLWVASGAIDGQDIRERLKTDPSSGYAGLSDPTDEDRLDDAIRALGGVVPGEAQPDPLGTVPKPPAGGGDPMVAATIKANRGET